MKIQLETTDDDRTMTRVTVERGFDGLTAADILLELVIPAMVGQGFSEDTILDGMEEALEARGRGMESELPKSEITL